MPLVEEEMPADPLELLTADARYTRVDSLRAVGLQAFADEEMAELLGVGVDALKMRVHRARDAMRSMMGALR